MKKLPPCNLSAIKQAILFLGEKLKEAEAIGIMGSFARGDFNDKSDIDVFVVIKERKTGYDVDRIWRERINDALSKFKRGVTVITYSVEGLKNISNWYVLRLASEGIIIYDKGGIKELFNKIIKTAHKAGLKEKKIGRHKVWSALHIEPGQRLVLKVED